MPTRFLNINLFLLHFPTFCTSYSLFYCRVSNLPEVTTDQDIKALFSAIGPIARIFLAKDKAEPTKCKVRFFRVIFLLANQLFVLYCKSNS